MKNKFVLLFALVALAVPALASTNDPVITTAYPQYGDTDKQLQARQAYALASWADGVWATNREITCNTMDVTNATTLRSTLAVTGASTLSGAVTQAGPLYHTKAALTLVNSTGNTNVAANGARLYKVAGPDAAFTISGIAAGTNGQIVTIYSLIAQNMTFANEDETYESNAANRITTLTGSDVSTTAAGAGTLLYDSTTTRWILLSTQP